MVDASVVLKWVLNEPGREATVILLRDYVAGSTTLAAPPLLMFEVASALARRVRRRLMERGEAEDALAYVEKHHPLLIELRTGAHAALKVALAHNISLWDAVYLTLALEVQGDLLTADARLFRALSPHYPQVQLLI